MEEKRELTDEQLIEGYRGGNAADIELLLERYRDMVRHQARALYLIGADQEDLIQEGMIGLFKAIRDFDAKRGGSFSSFARLCILRQLYSAIQASNRQKHSPLNDYVEWKQNLQDSISSPTEKSPEELFIAQEELYLRQRQLYQKLSGLERQVLDCYLKGIPYTEIAEVLGKTPKTIDNALQRIRKKGLECQ